MIIYKKKYSFYVVIYLFFHSYIFWLEWLIDNKIDRLID